MDNNYSIHEKFLENLAKAYTEYNAEYIIHSLADNFHYNSMWVTAPDLQKDDYVKYIIGKLETMRHSNSKFNFCIMYVQGSGEPHLLFTPKTPNGDFGCFVVKVNSDGLAEELSLTSSSFYSHGYKDKEKFDSFMAKTK